MPLSRKTREFASSTISKDSVFDWGGGSLCGTELDCNDSTGASTLTSAVGRTTSGMLHELQDDLSALQSRLQSLNKQHPPSSSLP